MATRDGEILRSQHLLAATLVVRWTGLLVSDDGQWRLLAHYREKCLHVYGTFNGARLSFQGTNEDANSGTPAHAVTLKSTLTDPNQNDIVLTSPAILHVHENPLYVRPLVEGGDGSTNLTVLLVCRH